MKKHSLHICFAILHFLWCSYAYTQANILAGKSFVNITRPAGGTVVPGDELEIRLSLFIYAGSSNYIYRLRYNDTIPNNLTYVNNSLKLLTNEGKVYKSFTDAAGDDHAMYNAANKTIRFNLGRDTTRNGYTYSTGNVNSTIIDTTAGGGYFNYSTHRPKAGGGTYGNGVLVLVTYHVTVDVSAAFNTIINFGPGTLRYRRIIGPGVSGDQYTKSPNSLSFILYPNYGLCSNATGANNITAGNGDFGSGTNQNGASPGAAVPDYAFVNIAANNPGDGSYSVVKNLSPNQLTDPTVARPNATSGNRVFGVWDVIGDHTGASDPVTGNLPAASGANGGYMLVVNSALLLGVANNQTISGLCEETFYEFSAWFRNVCKRCGSDSTGAGASGTSVPAGYIPTAAGDSSGVKPNLTFQINGVDYYTTGNIDYTNTWGQWVKKGFVFKTGAGQTSLTISIKNNAPGGGGNDWAMDDIAFATCLPALEMWPTNTPTYCLNNQADISVAVSTYFNNYSYYQWERSTDGGTTWIPAPELPGIQTFSFTNFSGEYRDTVYLPSFIADTSYNGYKYRVRVATTVTNLSSGACAVYNSVDMITLTVHDSCHNLSIGFEDLRARVINHKANLQWKAVTEKGTYYFDIESSDDGISFLPIGRVNGAGSVWQNYSFTDLGFTGSRKYYRVRIISGDGTEKISNVVVLEQEEKKQMIISSVINPFGSNISFAVTMPQNENVELQLKDITGRTVKMEKVNLLKGSSTINFHITGNIQTGTYILQVKSSYGIINRVLQKM